VIIESTAVERTGYGSSSCLALHSDEQEEGLRQLISQIRSYSTTPLGIQFGHSGRKASAWEPALGRRARFPEEGGWRTCGPSPVPFGKNWPVPEELDEAGLRRVQDAFVDAACRAARLDLNLLELHGAHGYLLHSFLSPVSNHRSDRYGGNPERRVRFVCEVVQRVRGVWPAGRVLGIRLNAADWTEGGLTIEDTIHIVHWLKEAGCDYVCVSAGQISEASRIQARPGYLVPYASRIRKETGIVTAVTGLIVDPTQAERVVADGHADIVAIARAFLDDPRWVWHAAAALGAEVQYPTPYLQARPAVWDRAALTQQAHEPAPA
jgi:2,4-dienoyl-CoA reductase-like NADH-dependent reductase (Old Yellow Enzyme family)